MDGSLGPGMAWARTLLTVPSYPPQGHFFYHFYSCWQEAPSRSHIIEQPLLGTCYAMKPPGLFLSTDVWDSACGLLATTGYQVGFPLESCSDQVGASLLAGEAGALSVFLYKNCLQV